MGLARGAEAGLMAVGTTLCTDIELGFRSATRGNECGEKSEG